MKITKYLLSILFALTSALQAQQSADTPSLSDEFKNSTGIFSDRTNKSVIANKNSAAIQENESVVLDFKISPDNLFACVLHPDKVVLYKIDDANPQPLQNPVNFSLSGLSSPKQLTFSKDASFLYIAADSKIIAMALKKVRNNEGYDEPGTIYKLSELIVEDSPLVSLDSGEKFTNLAVGPTGRYLYYIAENTALDYQYEAGHLSTDFPVDQSFGSFGAIDLEYKVNVLHRSIVRPNEEIKTLYPDRTVYGGNRAFLGPFSLTISPDENYAMISARGGTGQKMLSGGLLDPVRGLKPSNDDATAGIIFVDIRNNGDEVEFDVPVQNSMGNLVKLPPYKSKKGHYLHYLPTRIKDQADIRARYFAYARRSKHPLVTFYNDLADIQEFKGEAGVGAGTSGSSFAANDYILAAQARSIANIYAGVYKNYSILGAYRNIYTNDMIAPDQMALSPAGDHAFVPMRWTNNFGVLELSQSFNSEGYSENNSPEGSLYFKAAMEKSVSFGDLNFDGFGIVELSEYDNIWPEKASMTPDGSVSYFGIKGNKYAYLNRYGDTKAIEDFHYKITDFVIEEMQNDTENPQFTDSDIDKAREFKNRRFESRIDFASAMGMTETSDKFIKLEVFASLPTNFTEQALPKHVLSLSSNVDIFWSRNPVTFSNPNVDEDLFSDHVEAYNRFNSLINYIPTEQKVYLYGDTFTEVPNNSIYNENQTYKVLIPQRGLGYELLSPLGFNRANAALASTARLLERIGKNWHLNHMLGTSGYTNQPNVRILALSAIDGESIITPNGETAIKTSTQGYSIFIPYIHTTAGRGTVDFVKNDRTEDFNDSSQDLNFDKEASLTLLTELIMSPEVNRILIDPYALKLIKEVNPSDAIFLSPKLIERGNLNSNLNRDLDSYFKVEVSPLNVQLFAYENIPENEVSKEESVYKDILKVAGEDMRRPYGPGVAFFQDATFFEVNVSGFSPGAHHTFTPVLEADSGLTYSASSPFKITGLNIPQGKTHLDLKLKMTYTHAGKTRTFYYDRVSFVENKAQLWISTQPNPGTNVPPEDITDGTWIPSNGTTAGNPVSFPAGTSLTFTVQDLANRNQRIFYDENNLILVDSDGNIIRSGSILDPSETYTLKWRNDATITSTSVTLKLYDATDGTYLAEDEVFLDNPVSEEHIAIETQNETIINIKDYLPGANQVYLKLLIYEDYLTSIQTNGTTIPRTVPDILLPQVVVKDVNQNDAELINSINSGSPLPAEQLSPTLQTNVADYLLSLKGLKASHYQGDLVLQMIEKLPDGQDGSVFNLRLSIYRTGNFEAPTGVTPSFSQDFSIPAIGLTAQVPLHNLEFQLHQSTRTVNGRMNSVSLGQSYRSNHQISPATGIGWSASWDSHFIQKPDGDFIFHSGDGSAFLFKRFVDEDNDGQGDGFDDNDDTEIYYMKDNERISQGLRLPPGFFIKVELSMEETSITLTQANGTVINFDLRGEKYLISSVIDRNDNILFYDYTGEQLVSVTNDRDLGYNFDYYEDRQGARPSLLKSLIDPNGVKYEFIYKDAKDILESVTVTDQGKTSKVTYKYKEESHFRLNAILLNDEEKNRFDITYVETGQDLSPAIDEYHTGFFKQTLDSTDILTDTFTASASLGTGTSVTSGFLHSHQDTHAVKTDYYFIDPEDQQDYLQHSLCNTVEAIASESKDNILIHTKYNENFLVSESQNPLGGITRTSYYPPQIADEDLDIPAKEQAKDKRAQDQPISVTVEADTSVPQLPEDITNSTETLTATTFYEGPEKFFLPKETTSFDEVTLRYEYKLKDISQTPDLPAYIEEVKIIYPLQEVGKTADEIMTYNQWGQLAAHEAVNNQLNTSYTYLESFNSLDKQTVTTNGTPNSYAAKIVDNTHAYMLISDIYGQALYTQNKVGTSEQIEKNSYLPFGLLEKTVFPQIDSQDSSSRPQTSYTYDTRGRLKTRTTIHVVGKDSFTNLPAQVTTNNYDHLDRLEKIDSPVNGNDNVVIYNYQKNQSRLNYIETEGKVFTHYEYDSLGRTFKTIANHDSSIPDNFKSEVYVTEHTFNQKSQVLTSTGYYHGGTKSTNSFLYDGFGRRVHSKNNITAIESINTYHDNGRQHESIVKLGNKKYAETTIAKEDYHSNGEAKTVTDNITGISVTAASNPEQQSSSLKITNGTTDLFSTAHDSADTRGNVIHMTVNSTPFKFEYDERDYVTRAGPLEKFSESPEVFRGPTGLIEVIEDPNLSSTVRIKNSSAGEIGQLIDAKQVKTENNLDASGQNIATEEAVGVANNRTTQSYYNTEERISLLLREETLTETQYDRAGRIEAIVFHDNIGSSFDIKSHTRSALETPSSNLRYEKFKYDGLGRISEKTHKDRSVRTYKYFDTAATVPAPSRGKLQSIFLKVDGQEKPLRAIKSYNILGYPKEVHEYINFDLTSYVVSTYIYYGEEENSVNGYGKVKSSTSRIVKNGQTLSDDETIAYTYDDSQNIEDIILPGNTRLKHTRDKDLLPKTITINGQNLVTNVREDDFKTIGEKQLYGDVKVNIGHKSRSGGLIDSMSLQDGNNPATPFMADSYEKRGLKDSKSQWHISSNLGTDNLHRSTTASANALFGEDDLTPDEFENYEGTHKIDGEEINFTLSGSQNELASITAAPSGVLSRRGAASSSVPQNWSKYDHDMKELTALAYSAQQGHGWIDGETKQPLDLTANAVEGIGPEPEPGAPIEETYIRSYIPLMTADGSLAFDWHYDIQDGNYTVELGIDTKAYTQIEEDQSETQIYHQIKINGQPSNSDPDAQKQYYQIKVTNGQIKLETTIAGTSQEQNWQQAKLYWVRIFTPVAAVVNMNPVIFHFKYSGTRGRVEEDSQFIYEWDDFNRITRVTDKYYDTESDYHPTPQYVDYIYDSAGRRVAYIYSGHTNKADWPNIRLVYDGIHVVQEKVLETGKILRAYYYDNSMVNCPVMYEEDTDGDGALDTRKIIITDDRGTVVGLTDDTGDILEKIFYNTTGLIKCLDKHDNEIFNEYDKQTYRASIPFGWTGMYKDPFTGRYHTHFRDYDPVTNRWLSEDPAGYMDGLNLYGAYMGVNHRDPLGLEKTEVDKDGTVWIYPESWWGGIDYDDSRIKAGRLVEYTSPQGTKDLMIDTGLMGLDVYGNIQPILLHYGHFDAYVDSYEFTNIREKHFQEYAYREGFWQNKSHMQINRADRWGEQGLQLQQYARLYDTYSGINQFNNFVAESIITSPTGLATMGAGLKGLKYLKHSSKARAIINPLNYSLKSDRLYSMVMPTIPLKFDWGKYLTRQIGKAPQGMKRAHAHHILYKVGNGPAQQKLVKEGQEILLKHGIDPVYGVENLTWAPNKGHNLMNLTEVLDMLRAADKIGTRDAVVEALKKAGKIAAER